MIYGTRHKKIKEIYKKKGHPEWEDVAMWRYFRHPHVSKAIWDAYSNM
jgi:hypothetical protein